MSILAARLAATEGAYFLQESKQAVGRLAQNLPPQKSNPRAALQDEGSADILPEILRHSIPLKGIPPEADPSLSTASKWILRRSPYSSSGINPDVLNPLRGYVQLPQATFGPKRWQLPEEQPTISASTANALRLDRYHSDDSEKLKALGVGIVQISKAFAIATALVFGGATGVFTYTAWKLQMASTDDIRTKGRDLIQPGADRMQELMVPLRAWADKTSKKWHIEGGEAEEKSIVKEISKTLRARTSN